MTDVSAFQRRYGDIVRRNLYDPVLPALDQLHGAYILALYPQRFDPLVLWREIRATVTALAAGLGAMGPQYRQHVEAAYAAAAHDALSSREYGITNQVVKYLPDDISSVLERVEADYAAFVADQAYQYFWAKFDEVTSMLLTGIYLLVGYPYLPAAFYVDVAADPALLTGCLAILDFVGEVLV